MLTWDDYEESDDTRHRSLRGSSAEEPVRRTERSEPAAGRTRGRKRRSRTPVTVAEVAACRPPPPVADDGRSEPRARRRPRVALRSTPKAEFRAHRRLVRAGHGRSEADDQLPRRSQSAGAVQIRLGVAEVSRRLRESLDAAGSQHDGGHRAVEDRRRPVRRRTPHRQAQPGVLLDRRFAGRQQPRCWRSTA